MASNVGEFGQVIKVGDRVWRLSWYENTWQGDVLSITDGIATVRTETGVIVHEKCFDLHPVDPGERRPNVKC